MTMKRTTRRHFKPTATVRKVAVDPTARTSRTNRLDMKRRRSDFDDEPTVEIDMRDMPRCPTCGSYHHTTCLP